MSTTAQILLLYGLIVGFFVYSLARVSSQSSRREERMAAAENTRQKKEVYDQDLREALEQHEPLARAS